MARSGEMGETVYDCNQENLCDDFQNLRKEHRLTRLPEREQDMDSAAEVRECEERLRVAMLAGDVASLSELISDDLVFTGPDGSVIGKSQDLMTHQSGLLKFHKLDFVDSSIHMRDDMVITTSRAELAGSYGDLRIGGLFAYTRVWLKSTNGWRVSVGHASAIG